MPRALESGLADIFMRAKAGGMVAVAIDGDRTYFAGFGAARAGARERPDERALVRINSLTKVMTGEVLAALIAEGRIGLDDPLQRYAPDGRNVPARADARAITLRDLAAHTAGLPRDFPRSLGPAERWRWLEHARLLRPPGRVAQYANTAYMFLGDALETASTQPMSALLAKYVTAPLALGDTTLTPSAEQCARLMTGRATHDCTDTRIIGAMGGLYSTAHDMARWMHAQATAAQGSPRWLAQQPLVTRGELERLIALDFAGEADAVAMGWLRMRLGGETVLQKTGGGGGFMNYVVIAPARGRGIFITVNRADIEMLRKLTMRTNALMRRFLAAGER